MMHYEIRISQQNHTRLHKHAETNLPREAVALLFGVMSEYIVRVNRVELMENESNFSVSIIKILHLDIQKVINLIQNI